MNAEVIEVESSDKDDEDDGRRDPRSKPHKHLSERQQLLLVEAALRHMSSYEMETGRVSRPRMMHLQSDKTWKI